MALTATATKETLDVVKTCLSLVNPVVVGLSPNRPNIKLYVEGCRELETFSRQLSDDLKMKRLNHPKTVIFCRNYEACSNLYANLIDHMGVHKTEPIGYPNLLKHRMFTMYTRASTDSMKEKVMAAFCSDSNLRVVIATSAFSMGIDCRNIQKIIHWGAPSELEQYVQEIGRAGRDGMKSEAILMYGQSNKYVKQSMKNYLENKLKCRRSMLYSPFLMYEHNKDYIKCECCDICALSCDCIICKSIDRL